jgi:GNAT superfamily N-acetyltransferase
VGIYRPYADEVPWDLLADSTAAEDELAAVLALNFLRVAKYGDRVAGAYGIRPVTATRFELVTLIVAEGFRRQGLGRWLAGHAIGLAETKGAREIVYHGATGRRFLERLGFEPQGSHLLLTLTPE